MKKVCIVVTMVLFIVAARAGMAQGQDGWVQFKGFKYRLTTVEGTWSEAEAEAIRHGGHLATINSREENDWLVRTFGNDKSFWIGFYQPAGSQEPAGGWRWVSGERVVYTNWDGGQPDNYTGRDNYAMLLSGAGGRWHDVPLEGWPMTSRFRGIIKVKAELECAVFRGVEYCLTPSEGDWNQAEAEAIRHGGHLATINSREENDWLVRTFGNDKSFWIGFYQPAGSQEPAGGWRWVSGERVVYTNWDGGQPDNYTGRDNYAMLL
ncbi:MAG TPA: lectin-like protein, partial [Syntrophales bacterium]|nr:lectin-like protein [Syntrophales bacterium]